MEESIRIAGISGSLRKGSFNTSLLRAAKELLPDGAQLEIIEYSKLPIYNGDLDLPAAQARPEAVEQFRKQLDLCDAVLVASPEYNYSIPGGLKNAIDWASRGKDSPMLKKPAGIMGATTGMWGTIRAQQNLRQIFQYLDMVVVPQPEILVAKAKEKFDKNGQFTDEAGRELLARYMEKLCDLAKQLKLTRVAS